MTRMSCYAAVLLVFLSVDGRGTRAEQATPTSRGVPAVPLDPVPTILEAFKTHRVVAIGDAHGNEQGLAFQIALLRAPPFIDIVDDILIELGNSKHQEVLDRFVQGDAVPEEALQPVWRDTAQPQAAPWRMPELIKVVREVNVANKTRRRLRVLLGEPPIDWATVRTIDDLRAVQSAPAANPDRFAADVVNREVLAKGRRVLALYGAGHFFRKNVTHSLVSLLEEAGTTKAFTIWTNSVADIAEMQSDVTTWRTPSLVRLRGTVLGQTPFEAFFGRGADIPAQWKVPMQDQFDALLYLGPPASITFASAEQWPCSDLHLQNAFGAPLSYAVRLRID